ncbi:arginase (plasmid) [Candidatus Bandiella numerosa]|uniref:arginase n=1 Tax=Candidatus Bandiella numerosa TaxID=2570586 RepID=UPI00249EF2C2|nr:arginase [Candidatus Bandiella numerosa]WHA05724.1 arginase [Candidatus Bandiella numerosa]
MAYSKFNKIALIGSAFGQGAQNFSTNMAPIYLKEVYNLTSKLQSSDIESYWYSIVEVKASSYLNSIVCNQGKNYQSVFENITQLRDVLKNFFTNTKLEFPVIIGGDHSCAIGSWSRIIEFYNAKKKYGLIWIDAHMDAHTIESSMSKAYHGMPLSFLLGTNTTHFNLSSGCFICPENLVIIGARSFEKAEKDFLDKLQVRVFYMDEVKKRGLNSILQEAIKIVKQNTNYFGVSIDIDAIDPKDAPGTGCSVVNGLLWRDLKNNLSIIFREREFNALEIVEYNPKLDINNQTAEIIFQIISMLARLLALRI